MRQPGDILLVKNKNSSKISDLIMAGQRSDYGDTEYSEWTHAAFVRSRTGNLIEWLSEGCRATHISKYEGYPTYVISPNVHPWQRAHACAVADHFVQAHSSYDYFDFVGLSFQALYGWDISVHEDSRFICSAGVARCCISYVNVWPKDITSMKPADLAYFYGVHAGLKPQPLDGFSRFLDDFRKVSRFVSS